jgi:hypothetical protein
MLLRSIPVNSVVTGRVSVCRYKMRLVQEGVTVLVKAPWQESRTSAHVLFGVGNIELTVSAEGEVWQFFLSVLDSSAHRRCCDAALDAIVHWSRGEPSVLLRSHADGCKCYTNLNIRDDERSKTFAMA